MTATATIVTDERPNVVLAPNAAFRFKPADAASEQAGSSLLGALFEDGSSPSSSSEEQRTPSGPGRARRLYVLQDDGELKEIAVKTGATDGRQTEILDGALSEDAEVVTGRKASGS